MSRRESSRRRLAVQQHTIFEISDRWLLVFKPDRHREPVHQHAYAQRLRVLQGGLDVEIDRRRTRLTPSSRALRIPAGRCHATQAAGDTWVVVERLL
jgi:quercetin dioxygenase-like cupin family protein